MDTQSLPFILFLVFGSALIGGLVCRYLKLPLLLGYILAGILVGNSIPWVSHSPLTEQIAGIGITLLLFAVGLEFSFIRLKKILSTTIWVAIAQMAVCILLSLLFFQWLALPFLGALILAIAVSLSSTAIVVKNLSERGKWKQYMVK